MPRNEATLASLTSVRMYHTVLEPPFPLTDPRYSGSVTVPFWSSTVPDFNNWTGPTKLGLVAEGGGPKYERLTAAPTEAGAGNRLQPGPGPIGPGPGPCAVLGFTVAAASVMSAARMSILPSNALRGLRSRGESCAKAVKLSAIATANAAPARWEEVDGRKDTLRSSCLKWFNVILLKV